MIELLTNYSVGQIILFVVIFAVAIKNVTMFIDWAMERLRKIFNKETKQTQKEQEIEILKQNQKELQESIKKINESIQVLIESDKDDIKAWITEQHHFFCYEKKYIDDYSLDCIERRYAHYKQEGGNSFIKDLMSDIRALPKKKQL